MSAVSAWALVPLGAGLVGASLFVHARLHRFLPEDQPGRRKEQTEPLPMIGLVLGQIVLAFGLLTNAPSSVLWALAIALLAGTLDDLMKAQGGLGWRSKGALLLIAALVLALGAPHAGSEPALGGLVVRTVFAFAIVNAVNFLDNTNGVLVAVAALPMALVGGDLPAFAGCLFLGFLPFNWPQARCIAGDAGAYALGVLLAADALEAPSIPRTLAATLVPLCDFVQVVAMRIKLGFAPWIADRRHLPHIAISLGVPRWAAAPLFAALVCLCLVVLRSF